MSVQVKYLERHGWKLLTTRKRGMVKINRWYRPACPEWGVMGQAGAIMQQQSFFRHRQPVLPPVPVTPLKEALIESLAQHETTISA
jgi:hypothetical protein